ncbi:hypothetical protein O6P43_017146 [Quillaja saponaria]|uniref:Uncharacterized protein n=1 Tax=Quillaja saponaria TaxID=32244 RepID=A0AAD7PP24_QUISA|nr:hypothetical protein O6P43_017146 [Quillaja saponaria]
MKAAGEMVPAAVGVERVDEPSPISALHRYALFFLVSLGKIPGFLLFKPNSSQGLQLFSLVLLCSSISPPYVLVIRVGELKSGLGNNSCGS